MTTKKGFYWLSFANPNLPEGNQFLGACICEGQDFIDAVRNAHRHGVNPGGEVQGILFAEPGDKVAKQNSNILMSKEQLIERNLIKP